VSVISPAAVAAFAAALYCAAVIAARAARWSPVAPHPLLLAAVASLYLVIALVATRRTGLVRRVAGFVTLVAIHALIVAGTAYVWTLATDVPLRSTLIDALWAFPPAAILQALCVPIMAWPLRRLFTRPPSVPVVTAHVRRSAPLPKAQAVSWPAAAPASTAAGAAHGGPADSTVVAQVAEDDAVPAWPVRTLPSRSSRETGTAPEHEGGTAPLDQDAPPVSMASAPLELSTPLELEGPQVGDADPSASVPAPSQAEEADVRSEEGHDVSAGEPVKAAALMPWMMEALEDDESAAKVRISFEALADQIPSGVLVVPPAEVAAELVEPGYVLVPETFVLPQLVEGRVCVPWRVIGRQLPDGALADARAAIDERLAELLIELPLEDIVCQLSAEVFADAAEPVDLAGLEKFPMPFQPSGAPLTMEDAEAVTAELDESEPDEELVEAPVMDVADDEAEGDRPLEIVVPVAERSLDLPVAHEIAPPPTVVPREIRALFGRLNGFEIDADTMDGMALYRVVGPEMSADAVREIATRLLSPLRQGWSRRGLDQITVRGGTAAVVVTALGDLDGTGAVLAAGMRRGPGLALVELLGRRGAAAWPSDRPLVAADGISVPHAEAGEDVEGDDLARIAPGMTAFGSVGGRRVAGDGALVYAFVDARRVAAAEVAAFARQVVDAVTSADLAGLGPLESVTGRRGSEQVVIRAVARPLGVTRLVAAVGAVDRPGLAQRQVERAAALLAAEGV
jgi:hypothetical protein